MKVAVISSQVFAVPLGGYGGLEVIAYKCAEGLRDLKTGSTYNQVTLFAPDGSIPPYGVELIPTGPPGQWDERTAYGGQWIEPQNPNEKRVFKPGYWQELLKFDVIIDHSWQKWAYMLKAEGRLKAPVLGVFHAPVNTMQWANDMPVEKTCVVCISKDAVAHFEALYAPRQARHCYNGIDLDFYKPLEVPRSKRFLFLARFSTIKGPDLAIEACHKAGVELDLVGDTSITNEPEYLERCTRMAQEASVYARDAEGRTVKTPQIEMRGPASRGECVWWFSQAHCLLHPNMRFREPFGLAPVEAMACGCPVIAWDYGAMRETVKHGVTGLLANTVQEFQTYIQCGWMKNVVKQDRLDIREWASQFSVQAMCKRYAELCQEAVEGGGW